jgi:hypothetical protein
VLGGMVQHVQPDESRKKVVMLHGLASFWLSTIEFRFRIPIVTLSGGGVNRRPVT